jgi:hypothetical protein
VRKVKEERRRRERKKGCKEEAGGRVRGAWCKCEELLLLEAPLLQEICFSAATSCLSLSNVCLSCFSDLGGCVVAVLKMPLPPRSL